MSDETTETTGAGEMAFAKPYLREANPDSGKAGAFITLRGSGLASVTKVTYTLGSTTVQDSKPSVVNDSAVRSTVPSSMGNGNGTVTVTNPAGTSDPTDFAFLVS